MCCCQTLAFWNKVVRVNEDLVVDEEDDVNELDGGVVAEDGVVGLDNGSGNLKGGFE